MTVGARPRDRRQQLLDHAADLFADRGFTAVSVAQIGQATGITATALYRHFPSKDALLDASLLQTVQMYRTSADEAVEGAPELLALPAVVDAAVQLGVDHGGMLATYVRERHRAGADTRKLMRAQEAAIGRIWAKAIRAHQPDLGRSQIVERQQAMHGVLGSLARHPGRMTRVQRTLVTNGLVGLAASPPVLQREAAAPAGRDWAPTPTRRHEILNVALSLFADRGMHGVGLAEVADSLSMSGPSLYEYFSNKTEILLDAYDRAGALVVAGVADALESARDADDALNRVIGSFISVCFANVDLITVTTREGSSLPADDRPRLARRRRDLHDSWNAVLRELRPSLSAPDGRLLVRSAFALCQHLARLGPARPSKPAAIALVRELLLGGPASKENR